MNIRDKAFNVALLSLFGENFQIDFTNEEIGLSDEGVEMVGSAVKEFCETMSEDEKMMFKELAISTVRDFHDSLLHLMEQEPVESEEK